MTPNSALHQFIASAVAAGCPADQTENFVRAGIILQARQLAAAAAARLCDQPDGPTAVGFGGARGGGKSHWLLAQMGADDCQRFPGLKCLLLRKGLKSNLEKFEDLRQRLFQSLPYSFNASAHHLTFQNTSRIYVRHYQTENEIDSFLGLEYDVIGIEEATTLTERKYQDIQTCCRTSKPGWRPRIYSTTNPGGVGHQWFYALYVQPFESHTESRTRFIPARVQDNSFNNPEYKSILAACTGWQKAAWLDGAWNIAAGQFFTNFLPEVHVLQSFDDDLAVEWSAAMDYGYSHYTVILLGCRDAQDNIYIVDEHAERQWVPQRHIAAAQAMFQRHQLLPDSPGTSPASARHRLARFVAGADLFSTESNGLSIASHFSALGLRPRPANTNRIEGWTEILRRLGDPDAGVPATLFFHKRCTRLLGCLPFLQRDPEEPADVLKTNPNDEGLGGDDAADALRYLLATRRPTIVQCKLRGL